MTLEYKGPHKALIDRIIQENKGDLGNVDFFIKDEDGVFNVNNEPSSEVDDALIYAMEAMAVLDGVTPEDGAEGVWRIIFGRSHLLASGLDILKQIESSQTPGLIKGLFSIDKNWQETPVLVHALLDYGEAFGKDKVQKHVLELFENVVTIKYCREFEGLQGRMEPVKQRYAELFSDEATLSFLTDAFNALREIDEAEESKRTSFAALRALLEGNEKAAMARSHKGQAKVVGELHSNLFAGTMPS